MIRCVLFHSQQHHVYNCISMGEGGYNIRFKIVSAKDHKCKAPVEYKCKQIWIYIRELLLKLLITIVRYVIKVLKHRNIIVIAYNLIR